MYEWCILSTPTVLVNSETVSMTSSDVVFVLIGFRFSALLNSITIYLCGLFEYDYCQGSAETEVPKRELPSPWSLIAFDFDILLCSVINFCLFPRVNGIVMYLPIVVCFVCLIMDTFCVIWDDCFPFFTWLYCVISVYIAYVLRHDGRAIGYTTISTSDFRFRFVSSCIGSVKILYITVIKKTVPNGWNAFLSWVAIGVCIVQYSLESHSLYKCGGSKICSVLINPHLTCRKHGNYSISLFSGTEKPDRESCSERRFFIFLYKIILRIHQRLLET